MWANERCGSETAQSIRLRIAPQRQASQPLVSKAHDRRPPSPSLSHSSRSCRSDLDSEGDQGTWDVGGASPVVIFPSPSPPKPGDGGDSIAYSSSLSLQPASASSLGRSFSAGGKLISPPARTRACRDRLQAFPPGPNNPLSQPPGALPGTFSMGIPCNLSAIQSRFDRRGREESVRDGGGRPTAVSCAHGIAATPVFAALRSVGSTAQSLTDTSRPLASPRLLRTYRVHPEWRCDSISHTRAPSPFRSEKDQLVDTDRDLHVPSGDVRPALPGPERRPGQWISSPRRGDPREQSPRHRGHGRRPGPQRRPGLAVRPPRRIRPADDRRRDRQERGVPHALSARRRLPVRLHPVQRQQVLHPLQQLLLRVRPGAAGVHLPPQDQRRRWPWA